MMFLEINIHMSNEFKMFITPNLNCDLYYPHQTN